MKHSILSWKVAVLGVLVLAILLVSILVGAIAKGTNSGFVASAPEADPSGTGAAQMVAYAIAQKDTSPADATKITEIGWWCDNAVPEANFEVGLYDHNSTDDKPKDRLYVDNTNAKGTDAGWKTVAVDWEISAETIYWIAAQLDTEATGGTIDYQTTTGRVTKVSATYLKNPWDPTSTEYDNTLYAIYAVYETGDGINPVIFEIGKSGGKYSGKQGGKQ